MPPAPPGAQFGDAAKANRDGTGITSLGMKVPVGGLQAVNPGPDTWFAMHLTTGVDDSANNSTDRRLAGGLRRADVGRLHGRARRSRSTRRCTRARSASRRRRPHRGLRHRRDVQRDGAATTSASLAFIAARAPSMKVDGMLTGVSELGPIINRSLFVNAPTATMAGVYFVKY